MLKCLSYFNPVEVICAIYIALQFKLFPNDKLTLRNLRKAKLMYFKYTTV